MYMAPNDSPRLGHILIFTLNLSRGPFAPFGCVREGKGREVRQIANYNLELKQFRGTTSSSTILLLLSPLDVPNALRECRRAGLDSLPLSAMSDHLPFPPPADSCHVLSVVGGSGGAIGGWRISSRLPQGKGQHHGGR